MRLAGSVCLVTGATSGIGRAAALALARAGAHVVASGRDEAALRNVAGATGGAGLPADLAERGAPHRLAAAAVAARGRVDILVSSAGAGLYGRFAELDDAEIERLVALNVTAPIELARALLPGMLARRAGHVVNVGSIVAHVGRREEAVYAATKAALAVFSESLRAELAGTGVGVSLVSPGVADTAFFERRGAPYGRRRPKPVPAERVAAAVVRAVQKDRAEIIVPGWLTLAARFRGAAPGFYRALARRFD